MLRSIEKLDTLPDDESGYLPTSADSMILECEMYAKDLLIDSNGQCCWDAIVELNDNGFFVFCGERDSFGWLTGCIQTKKGIIVYG